jgi:hypothetical protein
MKKKKKKKKKQKKKKMVMLIKDVDARRLLLLFRAFRCSLSYSDLPDALESSSLSLSYEFVKVTAL